LPQATFQIPPRDGHPCLELMVGTINPHIGLSPTSNHPCWAHTKSPLAKAKGLEFASSPYWKGLELFVGVKL